MSKLDNPVVEYDEFRVKMEEVKDACNFIPDMTTDDGYAKSKRVSLNVGKVLTALEKRRKEAKAESLEYGRKLDSEAGVIADELHQFQLPHKEAYRELDTLRKEREEARKSKLEQRVRDMRDLPDLMRDSDSEGIKVALERLIDNECLDFYEFTGPALKARDASRTALADMFSKKLQHEKEQVELAKLRAAEEQRKKKEHDDAIAEKARKEAEDRAAIKIKQAQIAKEAAEQATKKAAKKAEADKVEAGKRAERERAEASERAEREQREAVERAVQAAKDDAERVEQERLEAQRVIEAAAQKRESNKRHLAKINNAAAKAIAKESGISGEQAKAVVIAIAKKSIPAVTINY
jgi:colicin import membrane protein